MITKVYDFADIAVQAVFRDSYMQELCRDYETGKTPELMIEVTEEDVKREDEKSDEQGYPYGYLESLAFYRKFCEKVVERNILLFHSSVIMVDGQAYVFTAPSGTGKSTHTSLWRQVFGERAVMINDDKPLFKIEEDSVWAYGTPWDGKHRISTNTKAEIKALCILERGKENSIQKESFFDAYPFILNQTYRPDDEQGMAKTLELVNKMMNLLPVYKMKCNISREAAEMAYNAMK
ncbi:MAG: hypothetical protein SPF70_08910 [Lachnospiraceae bacterium]|nr:hypothetical protein [Lachnospiraceae bacterium]